MWRRVADVSGCKRDFNSFSLMSVLTLISTVSKEAIQIIFVAIICAWRQKRKNRFNSTLVVIEEEQQCC